MSLLLFFLYFATAINKRIFLCSPFILASFAFSNEYTKSYDFFSHKTKYENISSESFLDVFLYYFTSSFDFVFPFLMLLFSTLNFSFELFVSFVYFLVGLIICSLLSNHTILVRYLFLFSISYISLFSGIRYFLAVILFIYLIDKSRVFAYLLSSFTHFSMFVIPFPILLKNVKYLQLILALTLFILFLSFSSFTHIEYALNYFINPIIVERHFLWYFLYYISLIFFVVSCFLLKDRLALFIALLVLLMSSNIIILDRLLIFFSLYIPLFYSHKLNNVNLVYISFFIFSFIQFILSFHSNLGVYI